MATLIAVVVLTAVPSTAAAQGAPRAQQLLVIGSGYESAQGSAAVRLLQRRLRHVGDSPGPIDGLFGPLTEAAVMRFQAGHGLAVDGLVGPRTRHTLRSVSLLLGMGAGYAEPHGSGRVRLLQRRLRVVGDPPGPIDGRFGPLTEAAVKRFQRRQGLAADGMVGALTHRALRLRAARALRHARTRKPPAAPTPTPARGVKPSTPKPAVTSGRGGTDPVLLAVAATIGALGIAALVGTLIQVRLRKSRYGGRPAYLGPWRRWRGQAPRQPTDLVLGYAVVPARGRERAEKEFRDQAEAIVAECRRRDLRLLQVIREPEFGDEGGTARPGLTYALRRISVGEARGLVVADLMRLAPTVSELRQVLDSLGESGARLVAAAQGLDTYEEAGEVAARVVLDLAESEHAALAEAADDPELRRRIARMRAYGMTTLEIVERLRQEGITSGRGSGRWRPSSRRPG